MMALNDDKKKLDLKVDVIKEEKESPQKKNNQITLNNQKSKLKCIVDEYSLFHKKQIKKKYMCKEHIKTLSFKITSNINHTRTNTTVTSPIHIKLNNIKKSKVILKSHRKTKTSLIFPYLFNSKSNNRYIISPLNVSNK